MNNPDPPAQLLTEILQRIAELNRQLPPAEDPSLLTGAELVSGPAGQEPACAGSASILPAGSIPTSRRDAGAPSWLHESPEPACAGSAGILPASSIPTSRRDASAPSWLQVWLEEMGILPAYAGRILEQLRAAGGESQPVSPEAELQQLRALLRGWWRSFTPLAARATESHVFVGPPGVGKSTILCKWLAQAVLLGGRSAYVWRLDGRTANTAEALTVYAEILGVPVARFWSGEGQPVDIQFFDLPGVDWREPAAVAELGRKVEALGSPQVHLVLNAAYETPRLLEQVRAFSAWPVTDLIFTHLDEETRWGKLWNFVIGTELPIRFLGAGQNVPGHFREATAELLIPGGGH